MIDVRQLGNGEWKLYRSTRLAALQDAPYAFGSNKYEREIAFSEAKWKERADQGAEGKESVCIIALDGDHGVGIAGGITPTDNPRVSKLVSMWVQEDYRGTDVASRLIAQIEVWSFDRGSEQIILGVSGGNDRAARFYEKMGFRPYDGKIAVGSVCEMFMQKPLAVA